MASIKVVVLLSLCWLSPAVVEVYDAGDCGYARPRRGKDVCQDGSGGR